MLQGTPNCSPGHRSNPRTGYSRILVAIVVRARRRRQYRDDEFRQGARKVINLQAQSEGTR